jgi:hypothetical protein
VFAVQVNQKVGFSLHFMVRSRYFYLIATCGMSYILDLSDTRIVKGMAISFPPKNAIKKKKFIAYLIVELVFY